MRRLLLVSSLLACRDDAPQPPAEALEPAPYDALAYVDPIVGTGGIIAQTTGVGPHAAVPFGMTLAGPDTRDDNGGRAPFHHYGGYHYDDVSIDGFSHTHSHGMGIVDFGGVMVMPRAGWDPAFTTDAGRSAPFDHAEEAATAGRYQVRLLDDDTLVDLVATEHGAFHRIDFAPGADPVVLLDLGHALPGVEIGPDSWLAVDGAEITGFQRLSGGYSGRFGGLQTHFVVEIEPAPSSTGAWSNPEQPESGASEASGSTAGTWVGFPAGTERVELRVALSVVDLEGARANLAAELPPEVDFEAAHARAEAAWREALDGAWIWGGDDEQVRRTVFHTAQYHTMLMPRTYRDVDGRYRGVDGEVHSADFRYLSDFSLWDTYRTVHPWYALVQPDIQRDCARSLVRMVEDGGALPRWPLGHGYTGGMVGSPAAIVLADTALKGIDGWDQALAFEAAMAQATSPTAPVSRSGVDDWTDLGWVTTDNSGSASLNLEYAWADAAAARWAEALGRTGDAEALHALSGQWRNIWDAEAGFFRGRQRDGTFPEFESDRQFVWTSDYVEGNGWHYLWMVPWDVEGMIEVEHDGDRDAFLERLRSYWAEVYAEPDDVLPDDWYWHGNEPVMHYAWLGALAGDRALTAEAVGWVLDHRYRAAPDGLDGNDDAGTLSAWAIWATLGLYPVTGTDRYAVGSPAVARARVETALGPLVIEAAAPGATGSVTLDGDPIDGVVTVITHDQLSGTLRFE
jgi:predicted alpha-1,2-mannosidase